jgi:ATP-dependent helicase/nuclease subunit B
MAAARLPRVFSIPAGVPFLPTLADALLGGTLVPLPGSDPLALAGVTVLLPTRRAVRAFGDVLAARLGSDRDGAAILPAIRPIGDIDEDEALLDPTIEDGADALALPQAIAPLTRRLALTRLTLLWATGMRRHPLALRDDEPLRIPASAADATRLAADLARLIDDMETAGIDWTKLRTLAPDDHAEYFRLTLQFLDIVAKQWPQYLAEVARADPAVRRDRLIRAAAARLREHGSAGPIVAAGSTGSIPATSALLAAIAHLDNGAVVLPGLDQALDDDGWEAIGSDAAPAAAYGHPQFGLKQLVAEIGIPRRDVPALATAAPETEARTALLAEAMRPASTLEAWAGRAPDDAALAGVSLLIARNEQEEATAIALAIREAVETPGKTAALVTPDRTLARRVAAELGRWGLAIDDSAGAPLDRAPHGVFARLLADAAASDADPVRLLALAKHPFAAFGMSRGECREAARALEIALFRGHRVAGGVAALVAALAAARAAAATDPHAPQSRKHLRPHQWDRAERLVQSLADCLKPLEAASVGKTAASDAAKLLADALRVAATDNTGSDAHLWAGRGGAALAKLLEDLAADGEAAELQLGPGDLPFFLGALLADSRIQGVPGTDPRIHIWGALEARLQSVDVLVLGGLDEGIWPSATRTDPWLSRAMRAGIGLPPPERRLGLSAHDFFSALAGPRVIVTRAEKRGGAPTVESRWLQRLGAFIGSTAMTKLRAEGDRLLATARLLDTVKKEHVAPIRPPEPRPPLSARPDSLSVTEIETLIRDPYAIYARRILKLEPLEPLGRPPDGGLRGNLMHEAIGRFTASWSGPYDRTAEARLRAYGMEMLEQVRDFPDVYAVWSLRMAAIAAWLTGFEAARDARVAERHAEIKGTMDVIPGVFALRGRADRIDIMRDGSVAIFDYKTSTPQTERTVFAGLTPQMTLEAAMVRAGAFAGISAGRSVSDLAWLKLGVIGRQDPYQTAVKRGESADELADRAHANLIALATAFANPDHPYRSRTRPRMESSRYIGDYDHLARVREWALVESLADVAAMPSGGSQ